MTSRNQYEDLLEELRSLRRNLARANRLPDFMVFSNETLEEIARIRPMTPEAMLEITGVGLTKLERYGSDFLRVIRERAGADAKQQNPQPQPRANFAQRDDREFPADKDADRFFVYILLLNNGRILPRTDAGDTREVARTSQQPEPKHQRQRTQVAMVHHGSNAPRGGRLGSRTKATELQRQQPTGNKPMDCRFQATV